MMGYEQFFGLNDAPFSLAPNPRYLFDSVSHTAALEQLAYGIEHREPLIVVTGEIGTGKTLLCRTVLQRLDRKTFVSVINDPLLQPDDLLKQMLQDFGIISKDRAAPPSTSRHELVHALENFLSSLVVLNAHAVVIIDEAQHVQPEVLEQIRLLANIDAPSGTKLQIILVGQLDLEPLLARPELRQVQQRVSRRIRLEPLKQHELRSYIDHRLAIGRAVGSQMPGAGELARALVDWESIESGGTFTPDAVQAIWRWSAGLPRLVNLLCDRSLEAACAQRVRTINASFVDAAAAALDLHTEAPEPASARSTAPSAESPFAMPAVPPAATFREVAELTHDQFPPIDEHLESTEAAPPRNTTWIPVLIGLIIVAVALGWFMLRDPAKQVSGSPSTPAERPAPTAAAPSSPAPAEGAASAPAPAGPPPAAATPELPAAPPAAAAKPATGSFEIIVASFRTEARAAAVAAQVSAAGLPFRRREVGGWLQVIAGPFASREAADAARQRLESTGLTGTQIGPVAR